MSRREQPVLNYFWVGLPANSNPKVISGQDIMGPVKMSEVGQASRLFVPKDFADYYREVFENYSDVTVQPIEPFLLQCCRDDSGEASLLADRTLALFKYFLTSGTTRNVVNAKNLLQLFVLYRQSGYAADSNILPVRGVKPDMKSYPTFMFPSYAAEPTKTSDIDGWLMYSPEPFASDACISLRFYLDMHEALINLVKAAKSNSMGGFSAPQRAAMRQCAYRILKTPCIDERLFHVFASEKNYHSACGKIFVLTVLEKDSQSTKAFWQTTVTSNKASIIIDELHIEKFLFNTHKYEAKPDQASNFIESHRVDMLDFILSQGQNPNAINSYEFEGVKYEALPLLHDALLHRDLACFVSLLKHGAKPNNNTILQKDDGPKTVRTTEQWLRVINRPEFDRIYQGHVAASKPRFNPRAPSVTRQFSRGCLWARPVEDNPVKHAVKLEWGDALAVNSHAKSH